MAKIIAVTLLLVILVDCFSDKTAHCDEFLSAGFTIKQIRECRCSVTSSGKQKCAQPLIPTSYKGQVKPCGANQKGFFKVKKCRQQQTHKYSLKDSLTLKYCLCCKIRNVRKRTPSIKALCNFSCFYPTPL